MQVIHEQRPTPFPAAKSISQLSPTNNGVKEQIHMRHWQPTQPLLPPSMSELRCAAQNMTPTSP
jgi:hypothetical protein